MLARVKLEDEGISRHGRNTRRHGRNSIRSILSITWFALEKWSNLNIFADGAHFDSSARWPSGKSIRLGSSELGFDSKSGQTNDFKIGIHSFPA